MCNDKADNQVKNGDFEGVGEPAGRVAGRQGAEALEAGEGVGEVGGAEARRAGEGAWKGERRGRGWTSVEKAVGMGEVYAFPEFGSRSYRSVPEGGEDVANGQWSRLRGLIDWEAVERARKADERAAERERVANGAKRRAGGWTWLAVAREDAE